MISADSVAMRCGAHYWWARLSLRVLSCICIVTLFNESHRWLHQLLFVVVKVKVKVTL
jgi:hypothetical protein